MTRCQEGETHALIHLKISARNLKTNTCAVEKFANWLQKVKQMSQIPPLTHPSNSRGEATHLSKSSWHPQSVDVATEALENWLGDQRKLSL